MANSFHQTLAGAGAAYFTALLTAADSDDENDVVFNHGVFPDHKPFLLPLPETLESLIPPSVLFSDFPPSLPISPRKRSFDHHHNIPALLSPEEFPPFKLPRVEPPPPTLDSILAGFSLSGFVDAMMMSSANADNNNNNNNGDPKKKKTKNSRDRDLACAKDRRRRITEQVRNLAALLPGGDRKMDTASLLEKAHGYIKFLQAQVSALESMPAKSSSSSPSSACGGSGDVAGLLASLTRQQMLQAVVNSPAAQAVMFSEKCCVVSAEQVVLLKEFLSQSLSAALS